MKGNTENGIYREKAEVLKQEMIAGGILSLWLKTERIAGEAQPGQFLSLYCKDKSRMLPRPLSVCEIRLPGAVRLVYRAAGAGTEELSFLNAGDCVDVTGPLGNGFPLSGCRPETPGPAADLDFREQPGKKTMKTAFLIGGGIGLPPMVELAKRLSMEKKIIAGYRDELFLTDELRTYGDLYLATEDGRAGTHGNVLDCIRENSLKADVIFACGPLPMLRAVKQYAKENSIPCWISLEERMACGIGACLACVCKSSRKDPHSQVNNKRICAEGPVFFAEDVLI